MSKQSPVMAIVAQESEQGFAHQIASALGYAFADIIVGTPAHAATVMAARNESPRYLVIDIGDRTSDVLPEIDAVAEHCEIGTRVVVIGSVNDVNFYRGLRSRGVAEYFTKPAKLADVKSAFLVETAVKKTGNGKVIAFMSAASGDGASTVALNTAYTLATDYNKSVVLVDMDYQFGMVAKNLDLTTPYGIKELFEHPDRGIDSTLIDRMIVTYSNSKMKVIAAPNQLHNLPEIPGDAIRNLITILRQDYDFVILDLPHIWTPWTSAALSQASRAVMVAQLWLRSVTHSSRLLSAWRAAGVENQQISLIINRSGARFKEAVSTRDFERVCAIPISYYFANDIKSAVSAENQGKTLLEIGNSLLARQFKEFAGYFDKKDKSDNNMPSAGTATTRDNR